MSAARVAPLLLTLAALAAPAPAARAAGASSCQPLLASCFTVTVPLDRSGAVPGTVRLRAARVDADRTTRAPLIALTGGPGQAGVVFAESFELILPSSGRDLVVLDQRGTGASGLLRCRAFERRVRTNLAAPAGACGRSLGARRPFYTSADSAADIEALRVQLGAPKIALYGVSYGTRVALEYARRFPLRVERMILDSPVGIDGPDPFARETLGAVRSVLRRACRSGCGAAAAHPVADLARLRARLRRGAIRRTVRRGTRRVAVRIAADDLLYMLVSSDLDAGLMRRIPRAVRAALAGRSGELARLKLALQGVESGEPISEFSPALFATTVCEESPLAWDPAAAPALRRSQARAALRATPSARLHPFDRAAALAAGPLELCADWPAPARAATPVPPLPAGIPALVLSGELDLRTPLGPARTLARRLGARVVVARGVGHGVLGADASGCADTAVAAFLVGRAAAGCRPSATAITVGPAAARAAGGPAVPRAGGGPAAARAAGVAGPLHP